MLGFSPLSSTPLSALPGNAVPINASVACMVLTAGPSFASNISYLVNIPRNVGSSSGFAYEDADNLHDKSRFLSWESSNQLRQQPATFWEQSTKLAKFAVEVSEFAYEVYVQPASAWEKMGPLVTRQFEHRSEKPDTIRVERLAPWQEALFLRQGVIGYWAKLSPRKDSKKLVWDEASPQVRSLLLAYSKASRKDSSRTLPWEMGEQARYSAPVYPPDPPVPPAPYTPDTIINFQCPWIDMAANAVFVNFGLHPCGYLLTKTVDSRKVYFVVNSFSIKRASDNVPITASAISIGTDTNSWGWAFNATIAWSDLNKVEPTNTGPVEVEISINGVAFRCLVEDYDENRKFGKTDTQISGRSVTAYLDAPYAPVRTFIQTDAINSRTYVENELTRTYVENELTRTGLVTGFSLDWDFVDGPLGWAMPANTWGYNNLTPMQAMQAIVQGAGGFINSHPANKTVIVRPIYKEPFWKWKDMAPDIELPKAVIKSQKLQWEEKPLYNGVYVTGERTGVNALVKITGTSGSFEAPSFVGPMISAAAAARAKGIALLSAGGRQAVMGLDLPMLPSVGLITPGMMISVVNGGFDATPAWRGVVRSTHINASWGDGLTVNQTVDVERHYGDQFGVL